MPVVTILPSSIQICLKPPLGSFFLNPKGLGFKEGPFVSFSAKGTSVCHSLSRVSESRSVCLPHEDETRIVVACKGEAGARMTMRLNVACYIFPAFGNQLALRRSFFSLSVSRHPALAHSLRHLARNAGRQRCVPSTSRRRLPCKWQVSAVSVLEEEGDELRELLEFRGSEWDAQEVGTSGKQVRQAPRGQKIQTRAERQQFDWRKGWEDRDAEVDVGRRYGSQGATGGDRFEEKGSARWERSHSGSHASSSTTRRDAFNRFLQRDSRQEAQSSAPADWEPGFYPNDARTASSKISTTSPWSRLSKSLADPPQESVEQGDGRGELKHVSAGTPSNSFPSPLPRLSKFFPDSIINPFSNPPPTSSSRGFFWQSEDKKELAEEGRKLAEDLWGKRSGSQAASRYSSKSVGSRSVPSRPSIPGRFSKYNPNNLRKGRQMHSTSPQPSSQSSVAAKPLLPENTTVVGSTHHKDQGSPALATGVPSPSLEWDSSPDKSCELAPSPSQDSSGSPQLPAPEDDVSAPAKGSKSDVPKVLVETFPPPAPTGLPFEFQYSYSEAPQTPPLKIRNEFSPFGPRTASRPWTGKAPLKKSKKNVPEFDSFNPPPNKKGIKYVQQPGPFPPGQGPKPAKTREEILGEPLTKDEINELVESCIKGDRQINLGRDGLTHNMLDLVHSHWKRRRCIKIKCKGVPTVDMDNVCFHLEDKTGGVIIYRVGGTAYLYRGRYYNYKDRPHIPLMLWKPMAPIYPKLCKPVPDGLTKTEVTELRKRGRRIQPLKKLGKNGVYLNLVQEVRDGFLFDDIVRIDCKGLNPSDYKKIGAKLKDLVPCVILSFEKEQILLWRGRDVEMSESIKHPVPDSSTADTVESDEEEDDEGSSNESVAVSSTEDPVPVSAEDDSFADALQPVAEGQEMMTLVAAEKTMGDEREESVVSVTGAELTGDDGPSTGLPEAEPNNSAPVTDGMSNDDDKARVELQEKNRRRRMNLEDLWERAIESGKALAVEEPEAMDPDAVKEKAAIMAASQKPTTKDEKKEAKGTPKAEVASILEDVSTRVGRLPVDDLVRFL